MKRLTAALFGLFVAIGVLAAPPASAVEYNVSGGVFDTKSFGVSNGDLEFYATCEDYYAGVPTLATSFDISAYNVLLPEGTYRVLIRPSQNSGDLTSWNGGYYDCESSDTIAVQSDVTVGLVAKDGNLVYGLVSSTISDVSDGNVFFYASCRDYLVGAPPVASNSFSGYTYFVSVPASTYRVFIAPAQDTFAGESWHSGKRTCADATPVVIPDDPGELFELPTQVPLTAIGLANVSGTVSSDLGPVTDASLFFYKTCEDFADQEIAGEAAAFGDSGEYATRLPLGSYRVRIQPQDTSGAIPSWHDSAASCAESNEVTIVQGNQTRDLWAATGFFGQGSVSSDNGPVAEGSVTFYEDCEAYEDERGIRAPIDNGTYSTVVPAGDYKVEIRPRAGTGAVRSWHDEAVSCAEASIVTVNSNVPRNLVARAGSTLSGTVDSTTGAISSGAVEFFKTCDDWADDTSSGVAPIVDGAYSATLPNGTYKAFIWADSGAIDSWHNSTLSCDKAATVTVTGTSTANLTALGGSAVTVQVSNGTDPVGSGDVLFYASCEDYEAEDSAGRADILFENTVTLPNGTYLAFIDVRGVQPAVDSWHNGKATCAEATPVTVSGDGTVNLVATPGSRVGGGVTTSNGPVADGSVEFYATCKDYATRNSAARTKFSDGNPYSLVLPNGTYRVLIQPALGSAGRSWHSAKTSCSQAAVVTVDGDDPNLDLVALPSHEVYGTVKKSGTAVNSGRAQFFATCEDVTNNDISADAFIEQGTYSTPIATGSYRVRIVLYGPWGRGYSWHDGAASCAGSTPVNVSGQTEANLNAAPNSAVTGTVSGPSGLLTTGRITFYDTCQDYQAGNPSAETKYADGEYRVRLPDGDFLARILPDSGAANSWHANAAACDAALAVAVSGPTTQNLTAAGGVAITGTVSTSNGPVKAGKATFFASCDAKDSAATARIRSNGYSVRMVPGTYRVAIDVESGYNAKDSWHSAKPDCAQATPVTVGSDGTVNLVAIAKKLPVDPEPPVTPPPGPGPDPEPPVTILGSQSAKKPPAKLKKGKKGKLAPKTSQGAKVTWKTSTKKVCTVKKNVVIAKKKGTCKLSAKAPAVSGFNAYAKRYTIKVK